jgi:hypothetical protein
MSSELLRTIEIAVDHQASNSMMSSNIVEEVTRQQWFDQKEKSEQKEATIHKQIRRLEERVRLLEARAEEKSSKR